MKCFAIASLTLISAFASLSVRAADSPAPVPAMIAGAFPYVPIPGAAAAPDKSRVYKVIFNVTRAPASPGQPVDGVLFAATDLSALRGQGVPAPNTKFALIFHGPGGPTLGAVDGILDNASYRAKFGVDNPNLAMLVRPQAGRRGDHGLRAIPRCDEDRSKDAFTRRDRCERSLLDADHVPEQRLRGARVLTTASPFGKGG